MIVKHVGKKFDGDNGVYYSQSIDQILVLKNKKFEMFRQGLTLFSCYVYDVEATEGLTYENSTVNDDLKLVYLGEL